MFCSSICHLLAVIERDYLLSWILAGMGQVEALRESLVFKGGTGTFRLQNRPEMQARRSSFSMGRHAMVTSP